jgi:hypothetical protein
LHGSSIAYDGLNWNRIAKDFRGSIESWATAGSSPVEWEVHHSRSPQAEYTLVVVSAYDLNEYWLCDFRADIVPLRQALLDLSECGDDWQLCKRILSQYPQMVVRWAFPTAGRSDGVMVGVRAKLQSLLSGGTSDEADESPRFDPAGVSGTVVNLSNWPAARLQRRLVAMRSAFQGKQRFDASKKAALSRLLAQALSEGRALLVVMPVSKTYVREFLTGDAIQKFNEQINDLRRAYAQLSVVRLDSLPALDDDAMFSDLVHLNAKGQEIATDAFFTTTQQARAR